MLHQSGAVLQDMPTPLHNPRPKVYLFQCTRMLSFLSMQFNILYIFSFASKIYYY